METPKETPTNEEKPKETPTDIQIETPVETPTQDNKAYQDAQDRQAIKDAEKTEDISIADSGPGSSSQEVVSTPEQVTPEAPLTPEKIASTPKVEKSIFTKKTFGALNWAATSEKPVYYASGIKLDENGNACLGKENAGKTITAVLS